MHVGYVNFGDEADVAPIYVFVRIFCITSSHQNILAEGGNMFDCLIFI